MTTATNVTAKARIDDLVATAKAQTGLEDFGGDSWREGLEVLVRSAMAEADLNDIGEQLLAASLLAPLVNRLHIEDWYARHPEIDEQDVEIEFLGVGFPRTGSTALSHLIGEDTAYRNLLIWEESQPCPPPGIDPAADRARVDAAAAQVSATHRHVDERLLSMLPQSPTGPMEDHDLMALQFTAQTFLVGARVPTYAQWFIDADMEPTYRYEKRVLKLLQWKTPQKRWRLKSPTHTFFLRDYVKVFPEARFVQTHREVGKVLPSVSDLYYTMLSVGSPTIDPLYVGELNMTQWGEALDRMLAFRADPLEDRRFFDIGFTAFQADPIAEVRSLYAWLGDELTDDTVARMTAWRAENPADKHGRHTYDAEMFGITEDALSARFGGYRERFGAYLA